MPAMLMPGIIGTSTANASVAFAVRRCTVDYRRPARLDDLLEVETRVVRLGGASARLDQVVSRDGDALVSLSVELALMDADGRPARMPAGLRAAIGPLLAT